MVYLPAFGSFFVVNLAKYMDPMGNGDFCRSTKTPPLRSEMKHGHPRCWASPKGRKKLISKLIIDDNYNVDLSLNIYIYNIYIYILYMYIYILYIDIYI